MTSAVETIPQVQSLMKNMLGVVVLILFITSLGPYTVDIPGSDHSPE